MFSKLLCLALLITSFVACGSAQGAAPIRYIGPQEPAPPPTVVTSNSLFKGRYWFHSRGEGMFESGVITADGNGHFTLHSMYANNQQNHGINTVGVYDLTPAGAGTAKQGSCNSLFVCVGATDFEALFVSSDGAHAMMVSMEGPGAQWAVEMDRDPLPFNNDLSTCDATSGTVQGCSDGWAIPANWK